MDFRLKTNSLDSSNRRFKIHWVSVDPVCGEVYTAPVSHGTITSPNYPNGYPHNRDCLWKIIGE